MLDTSLIALLSKWKQRALKLLYIRKQARGNQGKVLSLQIHNPVNAFSFRPQSTNQTSLDYICPAGIFTAYTVLVHI